MVRYIFSLLILVGFTSTVQAEVPHYEMQLKVQWPGQIHYLLQITNAPSASLEFPLNPGLEIISLQASDQVLVRRTPNLQFVTVLDDGDRTLHLQVRGSLSTEGSSDPKALVLMSTQQWLPRISPLMTYNVEVATNNSIKVFSPATSKKACGPSCFIFGESLPQEDLYLILGQYFEFTSTLPSNIQVGVLLFENDAALAQNYLNLVPSYLNRYSQLFGEYAYSGFYVVENVEETGYGMPGFTLLGPSVVRLPFILKSSLPHEVLHNWWGNGVYVDYEKGNWCEGLTTYFADHFEQKLEGKAAGYRRDTLTAYADFVREANADFPLVEFRERHNPASQAIGYGKSMMFFHMLNNWLGPETFEKALRDVYLKNRHQLLGFEAFVQDIARSANINLDEFYQPWLQQKGSVKIEVSHQCDAKLGRHHFRVQSNPPQFWYKLPVRVEPVSTPGILTKGAQARELQTLRVEEGKVEFTVPAEFVGTVQFDPEYEVFRQLTEEEKPVGFSRLLGAKSIFVLVQPGFDEAFNAWAEGFKTVFSGEIQRIDKLQLSELHWGASVLLFGHQPLGLDAMKPFWPKEITHQGAQLQLGTDRYQTDEYGWLLMAADLRTKISMAWISPSKKHDNQAWGRQLTHYSKFGFLVFEGRKNLVKTSFAAGEGPLTFHLNGCP